MANRLSHAALFLTGTADRSRVRRMALNREGYSVLVFGCLLLYHDLHLDISRLLEMQRHREALPD